MPIRLFFLFLDVYPNHFLHLEVNYGEGGKNMLFDNNDFNYEIGFFKIPGSDFNKEERTDKFLPAEEGFLRGNLMKDEYIPYKNLTYYKLKAETERETLLLKLMSYTFAIVDLNLYLDLHPEDQNAFHLFQKYVAEKNKVEESYIEKYGPITVTETEKSFNWIENPWPWDKKGGTKYV